VGLGVMLRRMVGMILGMSGVASSNVSMMPGGFVVTTLVMLCSLGVMLGCLFVVFGGFLVVVRSLSSVSRLASMRCARPLPRTHRGGSDLLK